MIAVSDMILQIRSRLNDKDKNAYKWSDEELYDCINSAIAQLSIDLPLPTKVDEISLSEDINRYKLPKYLSKVISLNISDEPIVIKSFEWMQNNKNYLNLNEFYACMDEQSVFLYPTEMIEDEMILEISYNYMQKVQSKEEDIDLPPQASDAILFYSMYKAMQVTTNSKNDTRLNRYLRDFYEQKKLLSGLFYKNKHSRRIRSRYKRV